MINGGSSEMKTNDFGPRVIKPLDDPNNIEVDKVGLSNRLEVPPGYGIRDGMSGADNRQEVVQAVDELFAPKEKPFIDDRSAEKDATHTGDTVRKEDKRLEHEFESRNYSEGGQGFPLTPKEGLNATERAFLVPEETAEGDLQSWGEKEGNKEEISGADRSMEEASDVMRGFRRKDNPFVWSDYIGQLKDEIRVLNGRISLGDQLEDDLATVDFVSGVKEPQRDSITSQIQVLDERLKELEREKNNLDEQTSLMMNGELTEDGLQKTVERGASVAGEVDRVRAELKQLEQKKKALEEVILRNEEKRAVLAREVESLRIDQAERLLEGKRKILVRLFEHLEESKAKKESLLPSLKQARRQLDNVIREIFQRDMIEAEKEKTVLEKELLQAEIERDAAIAPFQREYDKVLQEIIGTADRESQGYDDEGRKKQLLIVSRRPEVASRLTEVEERLKSVSQEADARYNLVAGDIERQLNYILYDVSVGNPERQRINNEASRLYLELGSAIKLLEGKTDISEDERKALLGGIISIFGFRRKTNFS